MIIFNKLNLNIRDAFGFSRAGRCLFDVRCREEKSQKDKTLISLPVMGINICINNVVGLRMLEKFLEKGWCLVSGLVYEEPDQG